MKIIAKLSAFMLIAALAVACESGGEGKFAVSPGKLEFPASGGTQTLLVTGSGWTATSGDTWIEVLPEAGSIAVTVGVNADQSTRSGSITVENGSGSKSIAVTQSPAGTTVIEVDTGNLKFRHQGDTQTVRVTSELEWTATTTAEWIGIVESEDGTGFDVVVGSNEDPAVTPDERRGTITVSNGVAGQEKTISVWQALALKVLLVYPHSATVLYPDGTMQLEVIMGPDNATNKKVVWESLDTSIVTVDGTGMLTAVSIGTTTVTVTSEDVDVADNPFSDRCTVIVSDDWTPGAVTFRSGETWTVGDQVWSDVVLAANAEKDTYTGVTGSTYIPDAMRNGTFGHMFSWAALDQFAETLCPSPWRAPSKDDFVVLDKALGGTGENNQAQSGQEDKYREQWGLEWAGQAFNSRISGGGIDNDGANDVASSVGYWSVSEAGGPSGYGLRVVDNDARGGTPHPYISPNANIIKQYGFLVRCVKAK